MHGVYKAMCFRFLSRLLLAGQRGRSMACLRRRRTMWSVQETSTGRRARSRYQDVMLCVVEVQNHSTHLDAECCHASA
jgi:hypothetical protein